MHESDNESIAFAFVVDDMYSLVLKPVVVITLVVTYLSLVLEDCNIV